MGGTGSGRWTYHKKKRTVEDCWAIDISEVTRVVDLQNLVPFSGSLRPIKPATGNRMPPVRCTVEFKGDDAPMLGLYYAFLGRWGLEHRIEEPIPLLTTRPNFGGVRWWFSCPRLVNSEKCGHRVGKLYRAPGSRHFACRRCLDLTYESCQKSHRYDRLSALMAGKASGEAFEAMRHVFSHQTRASRRRRTAPSQNLSDVLKKMLGESKSGQGSARGLGSPPRRRR
jgi:hypothetical protein